MCSTLFLYISLQYSHVVAKFSGMGRFTYPWCSAGILFCPFFVSENKKFYNYAYFPLIVTLLLSGSSTQCATQCSHTLHYASVFCSVF